jgi:hypothetical protein
MRLTWVLTADSSTSRAVAISLLERPRPISVRTSRSRAVRTSSDHATGDRRRQQRIAGGDRVNRRDHSSGRVRRSRKPAAPALRPPKSAPRFPPRRRAPRAAPPPRRVHRDPRRRSRRRGRPRSWLRSGAGRVVEQVEGAARARRHHEDREHVPTPREKRQRRACRQQPGDHIEGVVAAAIPPRPSHARAERLAQARIGPVAIALIWIRHPPSRGSCGSKSVRRAPGSIVSSSPRVIPR